MTISQSNLPQFIAKLYNILSDPRYYNYIQWGYDGKSFIIIDPSEFSSCVLSDHFKHSNMSSFVRQLNKYDFHKVKSDESLKLKYGQNMWEFAHKNFRKNRLDLISQITRKSSIVEHSIPRGHSYMNREMDHQQNSTFYNYIINTMSNITKYFEIISEDIKSLNKNINEQTTQENTPVQKVLIAEDNAACAKYASAIFKRNNFIAVLAESVNELNFLLANTKFEMILISGGIPDVLDTIKNIRVKDATIPIILTTDEVEKIEGGLQRYQGVDKILIKPFLHEELVNAIKQRHILYNMRVEKEIKKNAHF